MAKQYEVIRRPVESRILFFAAGRSSSTEISLISTASRLNLNEQVKRNTGRFPEDFVFRLTPVEYKLLRSQFATSLSCIRIANTLNLPTPPGA